MERQSLVIKDICRECGKTRVENYAYRDYESNTNKKIIQLTKEGLGIRSTARILKISTTTLLKRIVYPGASTMSLS